MGARQSKRSVDITSGKEGEAVAGAGALSPAPLVDGEARLEKIAELDVSPAPLKPQLNGDASHIEAHIPDKEKLVLDESAPENDKDGGNEKEVVIVPTLNGIGSDADAALEDKAKTPDSELEAASEAKIAEADSNKKNKKEKVKKKWSFRSISFSKKDKQKPAKKEENGEYAQLPEEIQEAAAPTTTESGESKVSEEILLIKDEKSEDKTPDTPVTEPLTNGSSTPESPKEETRQNGDLSPIEQPSEELSIESAPKVDSIPVESNPENLTLNGLKINDIADEDIQPPAEPVPLTVVSSNLILDGSPDESIPVNPVLAEPILTESLSAKLPAPEEVKTDISPELDVPPPPAATEIIDAPADPVAVIPEVCDKIQEAPQIPEVIPPPLPANPPPSSLTVFAESTMAAHLPPVQDITLPVDHKVISEVTSSLTSGDVVHDVPESLAPIAHAEIICNIVSTDINTQIDNSPTQKVTKFPISEAQTEISDVTPIETKNVEEGVAVVSLPDPSPDFPSNENNESLTQIDNSSSFVSNNLVDKVDIFTNDLYNNSSEVTDRKSQESIISNKNLNGSELTTENESVSKIITELVETSLTEPLNEPAEKITPSLATDTAPVDFEKLDNTLLSSFSNEDVNVVANINKILEETVFSEQDKNVSLENVLSDIEPLPIDTNFADNVDTFPAVSNPINVEDNVAQKNVTGTKMDTSVTTTDEVSNKSLNILNEPTPVLSLSDAVEIIDKIINEQSDQTIFKSNDSVGDMPTVDTPKAVNGIENLKDNDYAPENIISDEVKEVGLKSKQIDNLNNLFEQGTVPDQIPIFTKELIPQEDGTIVSSHQSPLLCGQPIPPLPSMQNDQPEATSEVTAKIASSTEPVMEAAPQEPVPTDNGVAE